jgi:hypothetical protein
VGECVGLLKTRLFIVGTCAYLNIWSVDILEKEKEFPNLLRENERNFVTH